MSVVRSIQLRMMCTSVLKELHTMSRRPHDVDLCKETTRLHKRLEGSCNRVESCLLKKRM